MPHELVSVLALRTAVTGPDIGGFWRIRGVRLVATDLGFSVGLGPERIIASGFKCAPGFGLAGTVC